ATTRKLETDNRKNLEASDSWEKLSPEQRQDLESRFGLKDFPVTDVSSESALLCSLDSFDLARWRMLLEAIPQRFANALQEAARLLEPKATTVRLPSATLRSETDVDAWLNKTGTALKQKVKTGPVIIS